MGNSYAFFAYVWGATTKQLCRKYLSYEAEE